MGRRPAKSRIVQDLKLQALYKKHKAANLRSLLALGTVCGQTEGNARVNNRIKLSLVIGTDILVIFWDLLAAIYHVSEMGVEHGIVNGQGLEMESKIVMPWVVCDELHLAYNGKHDSYTRSQALAAFDNVRTISRVSQNMQEDKQATPDMYYTCKPERYLGCARQQCEQVALGIGEEQQHGGLLTSMVVVLTSNSKIRAIVEEDGLDAVSPDEFVRLLPIQQQLLLFDTLHLLESRSSAADLPPWRQSLRVTWDRVQADRMRALEASEDTGRVSPHRVPADSVSEGVSEVGSSGVTPEPPSPFAAGQSIGASYGSNQDSIPSSAGVADESRFAANDSGSHSSDIPCHDNPRDSVQQASRSYSSSLAAWHEAQYITVLSWPLDPQHYYDTVLLLVDQIEQRVQMTAEEVDGLRHCHKIIKCKVARCLPLRLCEEELVRALIGYTSTKPLSEGLTYRYRAGVKVPLYTGIAAMLPRVAAPAAEWIQNASEMASLLGTLLFGTGSDKSGNDEWGDEN